MRVKLKSLYEEVYDARVLRRAKEYVKKGAVTGLKTELKEDRLFLHAHVAGTKGRSYDVRIEFDQKGELYDYECGCSAFQLRAGPCKHIAAAAFIYEKESAMRPALAVGSQPTTANGLIELYRNKAIRNITLFPENGVRLRAIIAPSAGGIQVGFEIGKTRFYVIRDLSAFAKRVMAEENYRYGERFGFVHAPECFDAESRELLSFVVEQAREEMLLGGNSDLKNGVLTLAGRRIDDFFTCYKEPVLFYRDSFSGTQEDRPLALCHTDPPLVFTLNKVRSCYKLAAGIKDVLLFSGEKSLYYFTQNEVYVCSEGFTEALAPLLSALKDGNVIEIEKERIRPFYKSVLMPALPYITADGNGWQSAEKDPLPEGKPALYLDLSDEGDVLCDPCVWYGEERVDPFAEGREERDFVREA